MRVATYEQRLTTKILAEVAAVHHSRGVTFSETIQGMAESWSCFATYNPSWPCCLEAWEFVQIITPEGQRHVIVWRCRSFALKI